MQTGPLAVLFLVSLAGIAVAQEPEPAPEQATHFEIVGLAAEDLLNLRATASASGMLIGRLPNGAVVKNLGCAEVNKYSWCKVVDLNDGKIQGWAASRYLKPTDLDATGGVLEPAPETEPQE